MTDVSLSVAAVMKPAGLEKAKGVITANYGKDATDPRWKDDAGAARNSPPSSKKYHVGQ